MTDSSQFNLVNFRRASMGNSKISGLKFPREGNLDRLLDLLKTLEVNPDATNTDMEIGVTSFDHIIHLAKLFDFIDKEKKLTNSARALLVLGKSGQYSRIAIALENTEVIRAWKKWANVDSFNDLDIDTCKEFINFSLVRTKKSTRNTRSSVLRRLVRLLRHHHPSNREQIIDQYAEPSRGLTIRDEPVFGDRVIDVINRIKHHSEFIRISTGWMSASGYDMVVRGKKDASMKILLGGSDDRGRDLLEDPLGNFKRSIFSGTPSINKRNQHIRLYKELADGTSRVRELHPKVLDTLHAKGYYFGDKVALSTSANMTWSGLVKNIENGHVTSDLDFVNFHITEFEKYFEMGEDITAPVLESIEDSWIFQPSVAPYLAYVRALMEIFGNIAAENRSEIYHLADFQQMIVASVLQSLNEFGRSILISPTGSGKTVMGSYVIAAEQMDPNRKVIIFAPNDAVRRKWEHDTLAFGKTPKIFSHSDIQSLPDNPSDSEFGKVLEMFLDDETLIVVDEVHRFRTKKRSGNNNLQRILDGSINGSRPRALFLTATPIGVGFENLQNLYSMLFDELIEDMNSIASVPGLINITLPFIVDRFGKMDTSGNRYLNYSKSNKYFGKRTQSMSVFKQGNEEIYQKISELTLTRLQPNPMFEDDLPRLDAYGIGLDDIPEQLEIENMQLSRLGLARAVFSSRSAALESIDNFLQEMDDKQFAHPDKTMSEIQEIKQLVLENFDDSKYQGLIRRLKEKKGEKILIFTGRIPSMMELVERIKEDIPGINVEAHVGTDKQKQIKRERFAPKAHHKKIRKNRQIDILISTDSLAEGVDLQDASVAIDYDLWWTPLTLQQRMGRLDRPTDEFREFEVWRFVNLIPEYNKIVRIDQYLSSRAMLLKRLIADGAYEQFEVRDWEKTDDLGIITVEIDELDDILGSDELKSTSYHIADLADAGDDIIAEALRLPTNFVTSIISEKNGTFALFKFGEIKHMAFVNHDSQEIIHSPGNSDSEKVMRNIRSDADTNLSELPTDHYERLEELVNQISEIFGYDADEIEMIFSASLRKE